jgi:cytochrome c553
MNKSLARICALSAALALTLLSASAHAADLKKGQSLVASHGCMGCHGAGLDKPVSPAYPVIAGQPESYLFHALQQYQSAHQTPIYGRDNAIMSGMVATLSSQDLHDIAAYVASLPTPLYAPDMTH